MFGIDSSELAVVALVALLVIGPKDLPRVMRMVGQWLAKARGMTRHLRAGFDSMMREAELEEMQKAWAAQNDAIMKASALPDMKLPDLGIREALPDLSAPNLSADEWMSPGANLTPDNIEHPAPDAAPPEASSPAKPRRNRAKATDAAPETAPEVTPKPRKPRRKAEPQPTES